MPLLTLHDARRYRLIAAVAFTLFFVFTRFVLQRKIGDL
jgi:hypothetical protein